MFQLTQSARRPIIFRTAVLAGVLCSSTLFAATGYSGKALGTLVQVTPGTSGITAGSTAVSQLCTETVGISDSNSVASVSLPGLATTGVVDTSVASGAAGNSTNSTAISTVNGLSLLGGLVSADAVHSVSMSIASPGGFSTSAAGTTFTNAKVLGLPILLNVAPNTRITLPGIGFVILNEQISAVNSSSASLIVNAIHIKVSESNILNLPIGTQLIVARAQSSTLTALGLLTGFGYGSSVSAGPIQAGRSALVTLACTGMSEEQTNSVAAVNVPGILVTGAVHTTATGTVNASGASGEITASVAGLDLLTDLVSATTITADAGASLNGSGLTLSDNSIFVGLAVTGHPEIGANPAPNTHVSIVGLGTLWLHRVIQTSTSIEVRMVELVVDANNTLGLPIGADVRLAVAHVGVIN